MGPRMVAVVAAAVVAAWWVPSASFAAEGPAGPTGGSAVRGAFAAAAREFAVPESLLMAYSYVLTGWRDHGGRPSADGGYGLMHLTSVDARGEPGRGGVAPSRGEAAGGTLARAAALLGEEPGLVRGDVTQNIRGGAAVLADEARRIGAHPQGPADWLPIVARLSDSSESGVVAREVAGTLISGADDERMRLAPQPGVAKPPVASGVAECPAGLACEFLPAAYETNNIADPNDYGNYDPADRPAAMPIKYIVVHTTEGSYSGTRGWFQDPAAYTSAHYVIRSSDGDVTQMVRTKDIAWHAGNTLMNDESIGIEHEAYAAEGATWFTDAMYRSSARLVRYLAARYRIPLDREHILGHDDVAGQRNFPNSHWDPGPFWDWDRYLRLLHAPAEAPGRTLVFIDPDFATNRPVLTGCTPSGCPAQPSSTVLLRTAPRADAPLLTDPVLGGGTTDVSDWSDKAATGRTYAVAGRRGMWTAIWFGGQQAWLPTSVLRPAAGLVIRPRRGMPVPVFPAALPQPGEWPPGTPAGNPATPPVPAALCTISGDQRYQLADRTRAQVYYARFDGNNVPRNHTVIRGAETYYRISFHHRFMYVRTADVELS